MLTYCQNYRPMHSAADDFKEINASEMVDKLETLETPYDSITVINVPIFDYKTLVVGKIDDVFDSIKVVYLETNNNSIIGSISQMEKL